MWCKNEIQFYIKLIVFFEKGGTKNEKFIVKKVVSERKKEREKDSIVKE